MKKAEKETTKKEDIVTADVVYDLESLFQMRFRDPNTGTILKVRKAFRPVGKLEFYQPEN